MQVMAAMQRIFSFAGQLTMITLNSLSFEQEVSKNRLSIDEQIAAVPYTYWRKCSKAANLSIPQFKRAAKLLVESDLLVYDEDSRTFHPGEEMLS